MNTKQYLGDGVYVEDLGNEVVLTTQNGVTIRDRIYLDESMIQAFIDFCQNRKAEASQ